MDFDGDVFIVISKGLCIIFLLFILFSNALLIYKNARKLDFYTRPKNQIIISLAIGDIFLALFPLVVFAKDLFEDNLPGMKSCRVKVTSETYLAYLIHFVYGLGISFLGLELIFRSTIHNMTDSKTSKIVVSLALSSFPWLLGLIVVLPLSLANFDLTTCESGQTLDQAKAAIVISVILPACAAVIMCIVINCCVFTSNRYQHLTETSPPMVIVSTSIASSQMQSGNGYYPAQQYPQQPIPGQYPLQQYSQQMNNPQAKQPYAAQQSYPATQPYTVSQRSQGVHQENSSGNTSPNFYQEKSLLMAIAIIYFFLVVPQAIFKLSYMLDVNRTDLNKVALVAISSFVFWIMVIRSFVTPLIMYHYSDD